MRPSVGSIQMIQCLRVRFYLLFPQPHGHTWFSSPASIIHSKFHYHLSVATLVGCGGSPAAFYPLFHSRRDWALKPIALSFSELRHIPIHVRGQEMAVDAKVFQRNTLASLPIPSLKQQSHSHVSQDQSHHQEADSLCLPVVSKVVWYTLTGKEAKASTAPTSTNRRLCYLESRNSNSENPEFHI